MQDVIIIGGGIVGCAIAMELGKYNLNIALLEKNAEVSMETTKANSGIVHSGYDCAVGSLKARFNVRGNIMFEMLARDLSIPFRKNGAFVLAFNEEDTAKLQKLYERGQANGVPNLEILNKEQVISAEPHINKDIVCALYAPTSGITFGYEAALAFGELAVLNGVNFHLDTQVKNIIKLDAGYEIETNNGNFSTRVVINAAGIHSDEISNFVNEKKYKIRPRKGEYLLLDTAAKYIVDKTIFQLPGEFGKGILVLPTIHDNVLIGPSAKDIDDKEDKSTTDQTLQNNIKTACRSIPQLPLNMVITSFSGLRSNEVNTNDFIVEEACPGFINTVGINSPGLTAAPAIAEYVRDIVAERLQPTQNHKFIKVREGLRFLKGLTLDEQNSLIKSNPKYGNVVCRCETITEGEIHGAIDRPIGAKTLDGIKFRSRAGTGRCQGGFCTSKLMEILSTETGVDINRLTKFGGNSFILDNTSGGGR